jgi:hypothetical protein
MNLILLERRWDEFMATAEIGKDATIAHIDQNRGGLDSFSCLENIFVAS